MSRSKSSKFYKKYDLKSRPIDKNTIIPETLDVKQKNRKPDPPSHYSHPMKRNVLIDKMQEKSKSLYKTWKYGPETVEFTGYLDYLDNLDFLAIEDPEDYVFV